MNSGKTPDTQKGQSGIFRAALLGLCPRCSEPTLFEAPARMAMTCSHCGLDLAALERGGRFVGLLTVLIAVVLMVIAVGIEYAFRPPIALQAAFWAPVTAGVVLYALRLFKTALLYASYDRREEAGE
ncbi:DUF983 domain-containing protein [Qipengyuania nanhaisediminis]|uniref:DUF983 domain-containing protein n=1 Tax=Qipengyuania nanhaisediminis TaxID=604088 RepID=UPI0038B3F1CC